MTTRSFALVFGLVFLLIGLAGFVPQLMAPLHPEHPTLSLAANSGQLFGLFPVNVVHNGVHLLFGLWGLFSFRSSTAARAYARGVATIYLVLTMAGFIPQFDNLFGLAPLYGNDIWLHGLLALVAAYFGWIHRDSAPAAAPAPDPPLSI